jgi:hypothetical protein
LYDAALLTEFAAAIRARALAREARFFGVETGTRMTLVELSGCPSLAASHAFTSAACASSRGAKRR